MPSRQETPEPKYTFGRTKEGKGKGVTIDLHVTVYADGIVRMDNGGSQYARENSQAAGETFGEMLSAAVAKARQIEGAGY